METYIYESPDGGDTIYRRGPGETNRELIRESGRWSLLKQQQLWNQIHHAAGSDPVLKDMLAQIEVYYHLKNIP